MPKSAPRREMFPKEFLADLNATKAAERCGYSKKSARNAGARLMANANIQKTIRELMQKRQEKLEITAEEWLRELIIIFLSDIANYIKIDEGGAVIAKTFEEMPGMASRAIESVEDIRTIREDPGSKDKKGESVILNARMKFKLHSKLEAGRMIGEHLGFLKGNRIDLPGVEKALYELSEKFLPAVKRGGEKTRSDEPK